MRSKHNSRRRRCSRKGSLSISTNAIVVLIVAVIMLGLIIGLITRGFDLVGNRFFEAIVANEPVPPEPNTNTPITLSADSKVAERGKQMGLKVKILNTQESSLKLRPYIKCSEENIVDLSNEQVFDSVVDVNDVQLFTYVFDINKVAPAGRHLCKITAISGITNGEPTCLDATGNSAIDDAGNDLCSKIGRGEFTIIIK